MEDLTGRQFGAYRIVAALGEGGMAAVYKAYHANMDRYVALKILPPYFAGDPKFVGRFEHEAKTVAKLQHPNILPVFDFGRADGYTYIVMPFVQTGTLADLLSQGPLLLPMMAQVVRQVASALDYAHTKGVVHRDIKPTNILLDEQGNCLLTDFGIAKMVEGTQIYTQTGAIVGTPAYMSPEQIRGETLDGRSDIYSLGIILYEMATGRTPFRAETPPAVFVKHLLDPLPPPRMYNADLPEGVERVILKALSKDREARYATPGEMAAALNAATLTSVAPVQPVRIKPRHDGTEIARPPQLPSRRRRFPAWGLPAVGFFALAGAVVILFAVLNGDRTGDSTTPLAATAVVAQSATPQPGAGGVEAAAQATRAIADTPTPIPRTTTRTLLPASSIPAPTSTHTATPSPTQRPQAVVRIRLESSSDWANVAYWIEPSGADFLRREIIETGGQLAGATVGDYFGQGVYWDRQIRLEQELERAQAGERVHMVVELGLAGLVADQKMQLNVTHGCTGQVVLEVQKVIAGSPVNIARHVSEGDAGCASDGNRFEVAVADILNR
jgi:serine/threonine-protein kinase